MTTFDAVIIGSGAGGAPVACRLCEAGWKVLIVERGKAHTRDEFNRDEIAWTRRNAFIPSVRSDPHTRRHDEGQKATPTTDGWISTVYGGGTVHMSGFFPRARADDARQGTRLTAAKEAAHSALDWAIPFDAMTPFYEQAERDVGVSGTASTADEQPALREHSLAGIVDTACAKLKLPVERTPRAIISSARPDDDRQACAYQQLCGSYGCPTDARGSMPQTYLRRAQRTGNLTVWTEAQATSLLLDDTNKKAKGVAITKLATGDKVEVKANIVVVAASAIESARLLLVSGDAFNAHKQVGKHLWFSLFVEVSGFFDKEQHASVPELMTGSPFIHRSVRSEDGMLHVGFVHDNPIHRAERAATETLDGGKLLWGAALKKELQRRFRGGRQIILEGFGEMAPHPGSYIDLDPDMKDKLGLPVARITQWHHPRDKKIAARLKQDGEALLKEMGATDVRTLRPLGASTQLQGGTCRFGDDPTTSVTSPAGHLHGVDNVYVTDGGSLPSSMTVPPTLTIIANSLRIAAGITKRS